MQLFEGLLILSLFAFIVFNTSVHKKVKQSIIQKISFKLEDADHVTDILVHSVHTLWISILSLIIVVSYYPSRQQNYYTIFPSLFFSSFYLHELYVRKITNDIALHHAMYISIYCGAFITETTILFNCFNLIEFGHLFHFYPYLLYKFNNDLAKVYTWNVIGVYAFFVVRIVCYVFIAGFIAYTNIHIYVVTNIEMVVAIVFGVIGFGFWLLQFWFWRDVLAARSIIKSKMVKDTVDVISV